MADERKVTALVRLVKASWRNGWKAAIKSVDDRVGSQDNRTERKASQDASRVACSKEYSRMKFRQRGSRRVGLSGGGGVLCVPGLGMFSSYRPDERTNMPAP